MTPRFTVALTLILGRGSLSGSRVIMNVRSVETCCPPSLVRSTLVAYSVKSNLVMRLAKYATTRNFSLPFRRMGGASQNTFS